MQNFARRSILKHIDFSQSFLHIACFVVSSKACDNPRGSQIAPPSALAPVKNFNKTAYSVLYDNRKAEANSKIQQLTNKTTEAGGGHAGTLEVFFEVSAVLEIFVSKFCESMRRAKN